MGKLSNLRIKEVKNIQVKKDDVIIMTIDPNRWDPEECYKARETVSQYFPNNLVIGVADGISLDSMNRQALIDLLTED